MQFLNRHMYTDVLPYEVLGVTPSGKTATVREMSAEIVKQPALLGVGGFAATWDNKTAEYRITSNPANPQIKVRLHSDGQWRDAGGNRYRLSDRPIKYYDRNF